MDNNLIHHTETFDIASGSTSEQSNRFTLPLGKIVAVGVVITGDNSSNIIDIGLQLQGSDVLKRADYRFWQPSEGSNYFDRFKAFDHQSNGGKYTFSVTPYTALGANQKVQVVFLYDPNTSNNFNRFSTC
ncbi:MAG: hypothetical protein HRT68_15785 [Flavobacteriaceae bacterium]|nr:hypothetical protein [Flavobacteriaceae bacterium]